MRVVFMGSSTFGLPALKLLHQNHQVVCVYTRPPKPAGRGMQEQKTPIHEFALAQGISVQTPTTLRTEMAAEELSAYKPDVVVVAAYGLILPQAILDVPKHGCINIHGSLLPRWRGAAPIHHALLNGDPEIGVTIMKMDAGLDTGEILKKAVFPGVTDSSTSCIESVSTGIREDSSACFFNEIHDAIAQLGGKLLIDVLDHLDTIIPEIQDESLATYANKVTKKDAEITNNMSTQKVLNIIRTFGSDFGGRFTYKGEILAIHAAIILDRGDEGASDRGPIHSNITGSSDLDIKHHNSNTLNGSSISGFALVEDDSVVLVKKDDKLLFPCADGMIEIKSIQRSGKRIMATKEFLNGFRF